MTPLLPTGLDIAGCRVELAEVVVEDLGDGRARLPSGRVLSRSEVWAANRAAAWEARVRGGSERGGKR